jgi:hypothetical protein
MMGAMPPSTTEVTGHMDIAIEATSVQWARSGDQGGEHDKQGGERNGQLHSGFDDIFFLSEYLLI